MVICMLVWKFKKKKNVCSSFVHYLFKTYLLLIAFFLWLSASPLISPIHLCNFNA